VEENKNEDENIIETDGEILDTSTDGLKISNDAVATYAGIAISEVQGVYGMSGGFAGITEAISGKKNFSKGIKVEVTEKSAKIDVSIVVEYGARIPDVAFEIQSIVKKSVETMTGLKVSEVNVHVNGVHMANEDNDNKDENNEE
jgi:uncharacterized alkaline shock family protein YloU